MPQEPTLAPSDVAAPPRATHPLALAPVAAPASTVDGFVREFLQNLNFNRGVALSTSSATDRYLRAGLHGARLPDGAVARRRAPAARGAGQGRLLPLGGVPARPSARQQPARERAHRHRRPRRWPRAASTSTSCARRRSSPASATAASGASRRASSTRSRRWACRASGTASATNTASSVRPSSTASRSSSPTRGSPTVRRGSSRTPRPRRPSRSAATPRSTTTAASPASRWIPAWNVQAVPYNYMVPGYHNGRVNTLRLWSAVATDSFDLRVFNSGDYEEAVRAQTYAENISKVLYPEDSTPQGKELRLQQQYFFVAASIADFLEVTLPKDFDLTKLPDRVIFQLNDTHPVIAVPELMRVLVDEKGMEWDAAWAITQQCFAYTCHTLLPEALEVWSVDLLGRPAAAAPRDHLPHQRRLPRRRARALRRRRDAHPRHVDHRRAPGAARCGWRTSPPSPARRSTASPSCTRSCCATRCCPTSTSSSRASSPTSPTA